MCMLSFLRNSRGRVSLALVGMMIVLAWAFAQQSPPGSPAATVANRPKILSVNVATNGHVRLQISGQPGLPFSIEKSTNLIKWQVVATNSFSAIGEGMFVDTASLGNDASFYRVMQPGTLGETSSTNAP